MKRRGPVGTPSGGTNDPSLIHPLTSSSPEKRRENLSTGHNSVLYCPALSQRQEGKKPGKAKVIMEDHAGPRETKRVSPNAPIGWSN